MLKHQNIVPIHYNLVIIFIYQMAWQDKFATVYQIKSFIILAELHQSV